MSSFHVVRPPQTPIRTHCVGRSGILRARHGASAVWVLRRRRVMALGTLGGVVVRGAHFHLHVCIHA